MDNKTSTRTTTTIATTSTRSNYTSENTLNNSLQNDSCQRVPLQPSNIHEAISSQSNDIQHQRNSVPREFTRALIQNNALRESMDKTKEVLETNARSIEKLCEVALFAGCQVNFLGEELSETRQQIEEGLLLPLEREQHQALAEQMQRLMNMQQEICEQKKVMSFMQKQIQEHIKFQKKFEDRDNKFRITKQNLEASLKKKEEEPVEKDVDDQKCETN